MTFKIVGSVGVKTYERELTEPKKGRNIYGIRPNRKNSELVFDTYTANPDVCLELNSDGIEAIKKMHQSYLFELLESGRVPKQLRDNCYGPNSGSIFVLKIHAERIIDELGDVLNNWQYWKHR